jgi:hypothetical protein
VARAHEFEHARKYALEATDLFRPHADEVGVAASLTLCGWCSLGLSDPVRAGGHFQEALAITGRVGAPVRTAEAAAGLGASLIARHEAERGTRLLGAASAVASELGHRIGEPEASIENAAIRTAKAALGEDAFAAAWARGEAMTAEEIVAFANADTRSPSAHPRL